MTAPAADISRLITVDDAGPAESWYTACERAAAGIRPDIPEHYRSRSFSGIIGDIKNLDSRKSRSLIARKRGLGLQYAYLYLLDGVDHGRGYQACAAEALRACLSGTPFFPENGAVLDVGCAVGVTAGVLGLDGITGFDLFTDLLTSAVKVDALTGRTQRYVCADMTKPWPLRTAFETVICGLVCHHLKDQEQVALFFRECNRVLAPGGALIVTLPAGAVADAEKLSSLIDALARFGFAADDTLSGLVRSVDSERSLFWMFTLVCRKTGPPATGAFVDPTFAFPHYRTPVSREAKGNRARKTVQARRRITHSRFLLVPHCLLATSYPCVPLVFEHVRSIH